MSPVSFGGVTAADDIPSVEHIVTGGDEETYVAGEVSEVPDESNRKTSDRMINNFQREYSRKKLKPTTGSTVRAVHFTPEEVS